MQTIWCGFCLQVFDTRIFTLRIELLRNHYIRCRKAVISIKTTEFQLVLHSIYNSQSGRITSFCINKRRIYANTPSPDSGTIYHIRWSTQGCAKGRTTIGVPGSCAMLYCVFLIRSDHFVRYQDSRVPKCLPVIISKKYRGLCYLTISRMRYDKYERFIQIYLFPWQTNISRDLITATSLNCRNMNI